MAHRDLKRLQEQIESITPTAKEIDPAFEEVFQAALKLLDRKMYTEFELLKKLKDKEVGTPKLRGLTVKKLRELSLMSDAEYARSWIRTRSRLNPRGVHVLRAELKKKRIEPETIEQALSDVGVDEFSLALQLAKKKLATVADLPEEKQYKRVLGLLQRRGFNYNAARQAWKEIQE